MITSKKSLDNGIAFLAEQAGYFVHLLKEFPILEKGRKIKIISGFSFFLILLIALVINLGPSFKTRAPFSPIPPLEDVEVAITHLKDPLEQRSPFQNLLGKVLSFKVLNNRPKRLQYEVFGYLPYWNFDKIPLLHLDLLSTIAYFALEIDPISGEFLKTGAYWNNWNSPEMAGLIERANKSRTDILVTVKLFENGPIEQFLYCGKCRDKTIAETVKEIKEKKAQGVNVDFEYLGTPEGEVVIRFAQFMRDLADAVHKEIPNSKVSMATYATSAREERIHHVELVGQFIDYVFIMGYDFFRPSSTNAGPVSPLTGVEKYGFDLRTSVEDFLKKIPAEKIVLGVPYYGYDWPVEGRTPNSKVLEYNDTNGTIGVSYYYNSANDPNVNLNSTAWDFDAQVPFYSYYDQEKKIWRQVYYENARSLGMKYDYIKSKKIRGVGIWALGFDGDRPELWDLLEQKFTKL